MTGSGVQSDGPFRVLMVVEQDVFDRLGSVVHHLCVGMLDEGVVVTVLSRSAHGAADDAIGPARVVRIPLRRWPWPGPTAAEALAKIGGDRPHVVHCLSARLARSVHAWVAQWRSGLVVHLTDRLDVGRFTRWGPDLRTIGIATTQGIQRALEEKHPEFAGCVRVVPLGLPAAAEPACLARPERVPAAVVTVPLTRDCGLEVVLKALASIVKGGQEVQLFVLASGPAERMLRRLTGQLGLRPYVTFAGGLGDWTLLRETMRGADFYILPRARRRFTVSTLTAMANGLAVLASTGTIGDYLIDGVTASLFDPRASRQLTEKWAALLDDRSGARRLAQGALDYIRTHHQASAMVSSVAGVYRELCGIPADARPAPTSG